MIPLWFSHALIMLALLIGTVTDFKKREVPDFLNFSLMGVGVILGILNTLFTGQPMFLVGSIIDLASGYLLGALMFYTGQWGGGDAKMLMGIGAVLGIDIRYFWQGGIELPLFFTVVVAIFITGALYGLLFGIYLIFKNFKRFKEAFISKTREPTITKVRWVIVSIVLILVIIAVMTANPVLQWMIGLLGLMIFGGFYLVLIGKLIEKVCMIKEMKVKDLTEGEWIAQDIIVDGKRLCGPKDLGISKEQIQQLKKLKIKSVIIKEGIPFIPGFLLGYITVLTWGNWLITVMNKFF